MKRQQMDQAPYLLDRHRRATVLDALREVSWQRMCEPIMFMRWRRRMFDPRKSGMRWARHWQYTLVVEG